MLDVVSAFLKSWFAWEAELVTTLSSRTIGDADDEDNEEEEKALELVDEDDSRSRVGILVDDDDDENDESWLLFSPLCFPRFLSCANSCSRASSTSGRLPFLLVVAVLCICCSWFTNSRSSFRFIRRNLLARSGDFPIFPTDPWHALVVVQEVLFLSPSSSTSLPTVVE